MSELNGMLSFVREISKIPFIARYIDRKRPNTHPHKVAKRLLYLFDVHGLHRNEIPRFFGHGLEISDVQSEYSFLPKVTDKILTDASELFCVRREWLDGVCACIYPDRGV